MVLTGTKPPPSISSRSCVYVVKRSDGMFYCGQSDNLASERSATRSELRFNVLTPSTAALCIPFHPSFIKSPLWCAMSMRSCAIPVQESGPEHYDAILAGGFSISISKLPSWLGAPGHQAVTIAVIAVT